MEAVVLFDYEKQQEDELDLGIGMTIQNVIQVDDGWCEGTFGGKRGMFPDNFVQLKPATLASASSKPGKPPPPNPDPAPREPVVTRATAQKSKSRRAKVTFSYAAENPDELTLQPGQAVDILGEEEDGWWRGKVGEKVGLFPSNFVEIIMEETTPPAAPGSSSGATPPHDTADGAPQLPPDRPRNPPPVGGVLIGAPKINLGEVKLRKTAPPPVREPKEEPSKMPELRKKAPLPPKAQPPAKPPALPPQEPALERAKVVFAYTSEQEDELTIETGDILEVVDKSEQDGWWKVKLNGKVGLVPDNFVELMPSQPPAPAKEPKPAAADPPLKKEPRRPPPAPEPEERSDFGVPPTEPLDSSAVKDRPHRPLGSVRPPSRSTLHQDEVKGVAEEGGGGEAPWQRELKSRKKKEPVKPPAAKPPPPVTEPERKPPPPRAPSKPTLGDKPKPKPPPVKPAVDTTKPAPPPSPGASRPPPPATDSQSRPSPPKPPEPSPTTAASPSSSVAPPQSDEWREALEKLREEFSEFKVQLRKEIKTLSNDLDEERKNNASLRIDIDRLKKSQL